MSAVPTTISNEPVPTTIGRAYEELAAGLDRLAAAVELGDVRGLGPSRTAPLVAVAVPLEVVDLDVVALEVVALDPVGPAPVIVLPDPILPGRAAEVADAGHRLVDNRLAAMAIELTKTAAVVLVLYQGALTFLPAPARPRFAPAPAEASPAVKAVLPSVTPAAPTAADGQQTEAEVDGDGSSEPTAVR